MVMVPIAVPVMLVQTVLPFGPVPADAAGPVNASANPDAGMASAAASNKILLIRVLPPSTELLMFGVVD
jgi:hypothetical protein